MTITASTADRLAKLLPRLASEHDGEVVATARAIGRTLTSAGLDWHALADAVKCGEADVRAGSHDWWANAWRDAQAKAEPPPPPDAPEARAREWGFPIWGTKKLEPWSVVAGHCLQLDWTIPKAAGGKFLTKDERARLKCFERWTAMVTNADAEWIKSVVVRCHVARERWRSAVRPTSSTKAPA